RGGLFRANRDSVTNEMALLRRTTNAASVRSLLGTPDGNVWLGFAGWGLGRLRNGHLARIGVEQGLYDDSVSQILADDDGWLSCGSDRGIFKLRQSDFEAVAAGR